jgi:predicted CoA-substrate-specific enzyme activase
MTYTMGMDIGSTYTKGIILDSSDSIIARTVRPTGSRLQEAAQATMTETLERAGLAREEIGYIITTGYGRHQFSDRDTQVTDLTANARGASFLFPRTRTVLDIGGQTMKASRLDDGRKVRTFRLNDKCASGTGMFLEKTVRYMGFDTEDIDGLLENATDPASISGVCTVFAESEVINHLSNSVSPENIMFGAGMSLTGRAGQLLKRVKIEEELTLVGGILRWGRISQAISEELKMEVNVADGDMPQFTAALGCAILGHIRIKTGKTTSIPAPSMTATTLRQTDKSCNTCGPNG